jgi:hypothetical protein
VRYCWLFILPFIAVSCQPGAEEWHKTYAKLKCTYENVTEERDRSEKHRVEVLKRRQDSIQNLIDVKFQIQKAKLQSLQAEINEVDKTYMTEYRKAQDEQSEKHGHVSTPAYERQLQRLEIQRAVRNESFARKFKKAEKELQANSDYNALKKEIGDIEAALKNVKEEVKDIFKPRLDSLQEKVNNHRVYGKELKRSLNEKEAKTFAAKIDSININPCKYVN